MKQANTYTIILDAFGQMLTLTAVSIGSRKAITLAQIERLFNDELDRRQQAVTFLETSHGPERFENLPKAQIALGEIKAMRPLVQQAVMERVDTTNIHLDNPKNFDVQRAGKSIGEITVHWYLATIIGGEQFAEVEPAAVESAT